MSAQAHIGSRRMVTSGGEPAGCPVHLDAEGVWHIEGHAAARAVLRSTGTRQAGFGVEDSARLPFDMRPPVLWRDGPEHREHRRQTARFFTPRRVDRSYRELMHRYAREQCDRLRRLGRADLSDLSFPLAVAVAADVLGLTPIRPGMARRLERFFTPARTPALRAIHNNAALAAFYLRDVRPVIRARRRQRRDDLVSYLIDEGCSNAEILGECATFAPAGMITTREFITAAAWHLFTDADLRAAYLAGDEAGRRAILHEVLRLEPVVSHLSRWATEDLEVPGEAGPVTIPAGARVDIGVAAANLDPEAFGAEPQRLCPARTPAGDAAETGLAFGDGPHRCPGAYVAIQETEIFLTTLFAMPGLRMAQPPTVRTRGEISSYELVGMIVTVHS